MRLISFIFLCFLFGCKEPQKDPSAKLSVVTTTNIIADLVSEIGGEHVDLKSLMGAGVDPHLYKAGEGDVLKLYYADIIFYNGIHLEGKLTDLFRRMADKRTVISLADFLPQEKLISSKNFGGNYDPHVWFNIDFVKRFCYTITNELSKADPKNSEVFQENNKRYQEKLDILKEELFNFVAAVPKEKRFLITAHDAFGYLGLYFDFQVVGLQGISTATEAGVKDVQRLADLIVANDIPAVFVENSVSPRMIEALQNAVVARGHNVNIGGELFSDSLGTPGTEEGTYIGMYRHNIKTITKALDK